MKSRIVWSTLRIELREYVYRKALCRSRPKTIGSRGKSSLREAAVRDVAVDLFKESQ